MNDFGNIERKAAVRQRAGASVVRNREACSKTWDLRRPSGIAVLASFLLAGCTNLVDDWSHEHHLRVYERYRLVAHHDLWDGRLDDAITDLKRALHEREQAAPKDDAVKQSSLIEMGGMYLACGKPKEALDCYNQVVDKPGATQDLTAEGAAGRGFCFLKLNEQEKAAQEFKQALQIYKSRPTSVPHSVFPIDLCTDCCSWGLGQAEKKSKNTIDFSLDKGKPLRSECLASRVVLAGPTESGRNKSRTVGGAKNVSAGSDIADRANDRAEQELQSSWTTLIQAGKKSIANKEFEKAERYLKSAVNLLHKHNDTSARMLESLQAISFFYLLQLDRKDKALPYMLEEIELQTKRFGENDAALIAPMSRYAITLLRSGNVAGADKYSTKTVALCDRYLNEKNDIVALVHANVCELRIAQGRWPEAELEGKRATSLMQKYGTSNKPRMATVYFMLVQSLMMQNKISEADKMIEFAKPLVTMPEIPWPLKFNLYMTDGDLALRRGDLKSAKLAAQNARSVLDIIVRKRQGKPKIHSNLPRLQERLQNFEIKIQAKGAEK